MTARGKLEVMFVCLFFDSKDLVEETTTTNNSVVPVLGPGTWDTRHFVIYTTFI
jgi:hypothetical protein